jgi:hypothetical protein
MKNLLLMLVAGLMVGAFIFGCSTEDPWQPNPSNVLVLSFVSGPSDTVAYGSNISFSWTSQGGVGEVTYRYRMDAGTWSDWANATSVNFPNLTNPDTLPVARTFYVEARDEGTQTEDISQGFYVGVSGGADTQAPTVEIVSSPAEGSYVATGSSISFTWAGEDDIDGTNLDYWYSFAGFDSDTLPATTIAFENVTAGAVTFTVWAADQSGNESDPASVSFTIQDATILYVDDFLWLDANGAPDMPRERDQKRFYRNSLQGYAFAERDVSVDGVPTAADMSPYNVIIWCADSDLGANDFTWYDNQSLLDDMDTYLSGGGKLLITGPWTIGDILMYPNDPYNYVPDTSFVYEWLGVDTMHTEIDTTWWWYGTPFDTLVAFPDSIVMDTSDVISWDYWPYFTWAIGEPNSLFDLPDSMKIDVAKNGDQLDYAIETPFLRDDPGNGITTEILFTWGLDVDGDVTPPYGHPIGHVVSFSGMRQIAMLNFDTYSMPLPEIRQTFQSILTEFGE